MTKFSFTDPKDSKYLPHSGTAFFNRLGVIFQRRRSFLPKIFLSHPSMSRFKKSSKRTFISVLAREISDHWKSLSSDQKNAWSLYSVYPPTYSTGYKAFFSNNMRLKRPNNPCLDWIDDITSPPSAVVTPSGVCVQFMSLDSYFCVGWTGPLCVNLFIQSFNWLMPGRSRSLNQPFKYNESVPSSDGFLSIDSIELNKSQNSRIVLRSLNLRGEASTISDITTSIKNAWPPGRYGIGRYRYSVYGPTG